MGETPVVLISLHFHATRAHEPVAAECVFGFQDAFNKKEIIFNSRLAIFVSGCFKISKEQFGGKISVQQMVIHPFLTA